MPKDSWESLRRRDIGRRAVAEAEFDRVPKTRKKKKKKRKRKNGCGARRRLGRPALPKVTCPYCGIVAKLVNSTVIYGKSYGNVWICGDYPNCDAYVGAHKKDNRPKGTLADAELRACRIQAHAAFDPLWREGVMNRGEAYGWLASEMGLQRVHIGESDVADCEQIVRLSLAKRSQRYPEQHPVPADVVLSDQEICPF